MIIYRHPTCPPWLAGALQLCERAGADTHYWGIGDSCLFSPPATGWVDAGDGVECAVIGKPTDWPITREQRGVQYEMVENLADDRIAVPVILREDGGRAFACTIGPDFLPAYTDDQKRLFEIGQAARDTLATCATAGGELDLQAAASWACAFIVYGNHVSLPALLNLGLVDEALVLNTLITATTYRIEDENKYDG